MTHADNPESVLRQMGNAAIALETPEETARRKQRLVPKIAGAIEKASEASARRRRMRLAIWLLAAAAVVLVGLGVSWRSWNEPTAAPSAARLASAHGSVMLTRGGTQSPARGQALMGKDQVRTDATGGAVVLLASSTRVQLGPSTELSMGTAPSELSERVHLTIGRIEATVPKLEPGASFEVGTPDALVRVHGTQFAVSVERHEGATWTKVEVIEGLVAVHRGQDVAMLGEGASWSSLDKTGEAEEPTAEGADEGKEAGVLPEPLPDDSAARVAASKPPKPKTAPSVQQPSSPESSLAAENALFQKAMQAARRGDDQAALVLLDAFLAKYPDSPLAQNARVERFRALRRMGRDKEASREARKYMAEHPEGFASDEARDVVMPPGSSTSQSP